MDDVLTRMLTNLLGRLTGPLTFRLFLQPTMAGLLALRDGLKDAQAGRPAYLWTLFSRPEERRRLLAEGWKSIGKVFTLAVVLDLIYQLVVFGRIYPLETINVAIILAILPYALLRGPVNRVASLWIRRHGARPSAPTYRSDRTG